MFDIPIFPPVWTSMNLYMCQTACELLLCHTHILECDYDYVIFCRSLCTYVRTHVRTPPTHSPTTATSNSNNTHARNDAAILQQPTTYIDRWSVTFVPTTVGAAPTELS
jgi:hypothetical protein